MDVETYPNEGPLWPCGCLVGSPYCNCDVNSATRDPYTDPAEYDMVTDTHDA